jgi:hypothetical protein
MADSTTAPLVVVFPRGQLNATDKERFTKAGILAVEADSPKEVVQLELAEPLRLNTSGITGDAIVLAALTAIAAQEPVTPGGSITASGRAAHHFVSLLAASLAKETSHG